MELTPVGDESFPVPPGDGADPTPSATPPPRALRIAELCLVLLVAFGPALYSSLVAFLPSLFAPGPGLPPRDYTRYPPVSITTLVGYDLQHLAALTVCAYVLFRQGRSLRGLGLTWRSSDLFLGAALTLASHVAYQAMRSALHEAGADLAVSKGLVHYMYGVATGGTLAFGLAVSAYYVVHTAVTGLFEELMVRAYLMKEISFLTGSAPLAVLTSVVLQASYHLYQGWPLALSAAASFFVLSLFYAGTARATPIVLAHMLIDLITALHEAWR